MVMASSFIVLATLTVGCSDDGTNGTPDTGPPPGDGTGTLQITIASPTDGAKDVSVSKPDLRATFSQVVDQPNKIKVVLIKDGKTFYGDYRYSATNLDLVFTPFNTLQSRGSYTFKVSADGVEASASFTTEKANEGALPPVAGKTYDFRIQAITYPKELADLFNSQLQSAPPVLMHAVEVKAEGTQDGNSLGSFLIAGSTGKPGDLKGQSQVLAEDETHTTTTSMAISGGMEGGWFGAGPSDLHLTASGIPLVIREFYVTGLFTSDGTAMNEVTLTGLIDPAELGQAIGGLDLSFICNDARFKKYCDDQKRIRVAASIETTANPIQFTSFSTSPVNASKGADPFPAAIQAYFSEEIDQGATTVKLTDDQDVEVTGKLTFDSKAATFKPDAPLAAATTYKVEVAGVANSGGGSDTRHSAFTTK